MLPIIDEFISALDSEIKELKKGHGGNIMQIYNGEFLYDSSNLFIYKFNLENILITMDDTPAEIEINGENYNCYVVTVEGQNVTISLEENLGNKIPIAKLKTNAWYLLEILKKKYEEVGNELQKFSQSMNFFSGESRSLNGNDIEPEYTNIDNITPNEPQEKAIKASINNSLCIIWGPPGTGKTRTIAKLVEAHLNIGRKVLLVSHANNAVDEAMIKIGEQLKKSKLYEDGKLLRFGPIKGELLTRIKGNLDRILPDKIIEIKSESLIREKNTLVEETLKLNNELKQINEVQILSKSIKKIDFEIMSIKKDLDNTLNILSNSQTQIRSSLEEQKKLQEELLKAQKSSTLKRIFLGLNPELIQKKIDKIAIYLDIKSKQKAADQGVLSKLNSKFTEKENQKYENVKILESELMKIGINITEVDTKINELTNILIKKQSRIQEINKFMDEMQSKILAEARLIGTTLTKSYIAKQLEPLTFDVLIVDEVSMAPQPMLFWAASKASLAITIVGDFNQLSPISVSEDDLAQKWLAKSIFDTLKISTIKEACNDQRVNLLNMQYRMHPMISELPRTLIYEDKLKDDPNGNYEQINDTISGETSLVLIDTSKDNPWASQISSGSRFNLYNALLSINLVEKILPSLTNDDKISIITPYRPQANLILKIADDKGIDRNMVRINTIHSFQGSEEQIVIFDTVEGNGAKKWSILNEECNKTDAKKLINVAITRAESKLYIIANKNYFLEQFSANSIMAKIIGKLKGKIISSDQIIKNYFVYDFDKWTNEIYEIESNKSVRGSMSYNEYEFWPQFYNDLQFAKESIIIFSPFIAIQRTGKLINLFMSIINRNVKIFVITKPPKEQFSQMKTSINEAIEKLQQIGVIISFRSRMHQKIAIIDNEIAWEGSLNILSYSNTQEQMRRIAGEKTIKQLCNNLSIDNLNQIHFENQLCPECLSKGKKSFIILRHGKYGDFYACSSYPECKWTSPVNKWNNYSKNNGATKQYNNQNTKRSFSQRKEWETSICYWSLEKKPGYLYSRKRKAWYKRK